jgi:tetratricopeptide (TPR) repeat protein
MAPGLQHLLQNVPDIRGALYMRTYRQVASEHRRVGVSVAVLRLEVREFESLSRWRWVLTGPTGGFIADYQVSLDANCWQYEAFTGLQSYLRWRVAPDRRIEQEAEIIAEVGKWIGIHVFGPLAKAILAAQPATVRVITYSEDADQIAYCPLALAYIENKPIVLHDVTLVMQSAGDLNSDYLDEPRDRLRVLGIFSLPVGQRILNLRRERLAFVQLFERIAASGRAVDVQVLQYGVTRTRLKYILNESEGWDIVHISGHGAPGELLLEQDNGAPETISAVDMAELLELARERLQLVSVSACWSAALAVAEQRKRLGIPQRKISRVQDRESQHVRITAGALATELTSRLGCAVLAMRYPVTDDFAIDLTSDLYQLLIGGEQLLPRALSMALRKVVVDPPTYRYPALSVATPVLFGSHAATLALVAPRSERPEPSRARLLSKAAALPPIPERFVGRTAIMVRANAALAPRSGKSGIVLHGMPGGGKTACALELVYTHQHSFDRIIWFKAPDEGYGTTDALMQFALAIETQVAELKMIHLLEDAARFQEFLPSLTRMCIQERMLIVLDNVESLLSESGRWHDERWGKVVEAMTAHDGLSRVILTNRRVPGRLDGRVLVEAVDALSLDEALLLVRELPNLSLVFDARLPGIAARLQQHLAHRVLRIAKGHPKLLELADGQADDVTKLQALVDAGEHAWQEIGHLRGRGSTQMAPSPSGNYFHVIRSWTEVVVADLGSDVRDFFSFLCCVDEEDRRQGILQEVWAPLRRRINRSGEPRGLGALSEALSARALVFGQPSPGDESESYGIHPGVAATGRALAGKEFQDAVDSEMTSFWMGVAVICQQGNAPGPTGGLLVRAAQGAGLYLMRQGHGWAAAQTFSIALTRDRSRNRASAMLPTLKAIAQEAIGTEHEVETSSVYAFAQEVANPLGAENQTREVLAAALDSGDNSSAERAYSQLIRDCWEKGRFDEAFRLSDEQIEMIRNVGLGPWTQMSALVQRLQVLAAMKQGEQVLGAVEQLQKQIAHLPDKRGDRETVTPGNVRVMLLDVGCTAALVLEQWEKALEFTRQAITELRALGAPAPEIARTSFKSYIPLLALGRLDEAMTLLRECRKIFADVQDIEMIGMVLNALVDLEIRRGHGQVALELAGDALRYCYLVRNADHISTVHKNFAVCLAREGADPEAVVAHLISAILIRTASGGSDTHISVAPDMIELNALAVAPPALSNLTGLCQRVNEVPGVHLDKLLARLTSDAQAADGMLAALISFAREQRDRHIESQE